jgi:GMP synthase (glutamine-hydrolysing)
VKPFLLLGTREHDEAARAEYESTRRLAGLRPDELAWFRLDKQALPDIDPNDYSGVILGGSGYCVSDTDKSAVQRRAERDMAALVETALERDFPFLGICYGMGVLAANTGGVVSHDAGEPVCAVEIALTDEGRRDPLLDGIPDTFEAFVGHKESVVELPPDGVLLGSGQLSRVQLMRVGRCAYATQFHPELDIPALAERMEIYKHDGYFDPDEMDQILLDAHASGVDGTQHEILRNFVRRFAS